MMRSVHDWQQDARDLVRHAIERAVARRAGRLPAERGARGVFADDRVERLTRLEEHRTDRLARGQHDRRKTVFFSVCVDALGQ